MVAWSALSGFLYLLVDGLRIKSLTYIDTAIFFPIYKALGPAMVTLAGVFIFFENLSRLELLGIVLGITVPLMLIHRSEK